MRRRPIHPVFSLLPALLLAACGATSTPSTKTRPAAADHQPYRQLIPNTAVTLDMVPIPGGTFLMGSPPHEAHRNQNEGPQVKVQIEPFWMGRYEVTREQFDRFREEARRKYDDRKVPQNRLADAVSAPSYVRWELEVVESLELMRSTPQHSAFCMSQFTAKQFCKWLSKKTGHFYRLPTEAEWEYACRAGSRTAYQFGNDARKLGDYAWHFDNCELPDGEPAYRRVGTKKANAWGLYDMHGNVAEWVLDGYDADHYGQLARRRVTAAEALNWPRERWNRVVRGGGWDSDPADCRSAARFVTTRNLNQRDPQIPKSVYWLSDGHRIGFRVVRPVNPPNQEHHNRYWNADVKEIRDMVGADVPLWGVLIAPPPDPERYLLPLDDSPVPGQERR